MTPALGTSHRHGVQKNGIHYGDNDVPPYDLADSTRLAEAYRLVSAVAAGGLPMFDVKLAPVEETRMAFAVADDRHAIPCRCPACEWHVHMRGSMVHIRYVVI